MKKLIYIILSVIVVFACDDRLDDLNTDKRNPSQVDPSSLFLRGLKFTFDNVVSINVNENPFKLYAQYWAQTTYPEESQYNLTSRNIPENFWENVYRDVLSDLNEGKRLIQADLDAGNFSTPAEETRMENQIATIDILMAYNYYLLVDAFGNVPFSEALDTENLTPTYDDAASVYDGVVAMLDNATAAMDVSESAFSATQDPLYGGDADSWVTFANTLKLRLGMNLADVNASKSVTWVNAALSAGVISSNAENASLEYMSAAPNTNPIYTDLVLSGRSDFVMANTFTDALNDLQDPRLTVFARQPVAFAFPVDDNGTEDDPDDDIVLDSTLAQGAWLFYEDVDGEDSLSTWVDAGTTLMAEYDGRLKVYQGGVYGTNNDFASYSKIGSVFYNDPTFPGTIFTNSEVHFLMAEAAARRDAGAGYTVAGTPEAHYLAGIQASFDQWGMSTTQFDDYVAQPSVAYNGAENTGTYKEKIGRQLWIALFNQGFEAWSHWRRLDFGIMRPLPGDASVSVPMRFTYPLEEAQLNGENLKSAQTAIGGDEVTTQLFWDMN